MIFEMHCHTAEHSACSHAEAAHIVRRNCEIGLQGTVLTDHHYLWPADELRDLRQRAGIPASYALLSGQEVTTADFGDVLVYGAGVSIPKSTPLAVIRERHPAAAIAWAHPYRKENRPPRDRLLNPLIDAVEIFSSNHSVAESSRGLRDWHRYKFTAIAGTDTHALSYSGIYPTAFDHPIGGIDDLAAEIRAGRCRPYFKEIPKFGSSEAMVTEVTVGAKAGGAIRDTYVIKQHGNLGAYQGAVGAERIMEELARRGFNAGPFRIPVPLGSDEESMTVFEQGIKGESLYDALVAAPARDAALYLRMSAQWLARLHNLRLRMTPAGEFLNSEAGKLEHYLSEFRWTNNPHMRRAEEVRHAVLAAETALYARRPERLVQGHGDFHPRNIYIGRDPGDPASLFVAAIDLTGSRALPPAYDVGTFIAQFRNQFQSGNVRDKVTESVFLQAYLSEAGSALERDFLSETELFIARTNLNICYFLIKVGLGTSENLWRLLLEAEHSLTRLSGVLPAAPA